MRLGAPGCVRTVHVRHATHTRSLLPPQGVVSNVLPSTHGSVHTEMSLSFHGLHGVKMYELALGWGTVHGLRTELPLQKKPVGHGGQAWLSK